MKNPKLIVKPFAKNGQKNVIPENYETSMDSNQATWDQGFGQITMLPVAAGGLPPKGQDFNGILNQISESIVYQSQGGRFKFSPEYAESIGGYPKGAILQSDDEKKEYQSLIDNNKVNFNTESNISTSWELVGAKYAIKNEVDLALLKKFDKENISGALGNDNNKVPSLNLLTNEVGKLATKGDLSAGLAEKQPIGNYAPAGNYASADYFAQIGTYSMMESPNHNYRLVIHDDGSVSAHNNTSGGVKIIGFSPSGEMEVGSVPAGRVTGLITDELGQSTAQVMSQKAVTDALNGRQPKGNYAPAGNYASADYFSLVGEYTFVQSPSKAYRSVIGNDGSFMVINDASSRSTFSFDAVGKLVKGSVSAELVTGLFSNSVTVTGSRSKGVTYTNEGNKPMLVTVNFGNYDGRVTAIVNEKMVYETFNTSGGSSRMNAVFMVPPNGRYSISEDSIAITNWSECV
ncbi:hypothetical protein [Providencia rustigianii]|uniref:hypothetical protein n=1 Tax=Providencia rustigianii TaxID=158850 RepID=UPI0022447C70|nr:hypothetical protein [Providencia rustigianii]